MGLENCKWKLAQHMESCTIFDRGVIEALLINVDDITGYNLNISATEGGYNVFTAINLAATKKGYRLVDFRRQPFEGSEYDHEDTPLFPETSKTWQAVYFAKGRAADRVIDELKGGRFVMVVKYNNNDYEIVGKEQPLMLTGHTRIPDGGDDNRGGWLITLNTSEMTTGNYLFDSDVATTEATYQSMIAN